MQRPTTDNHPTQSVSDAEAEEHNLKPLQWQRKETERNAGDPGPSPHLEPPWNGASDKKQVVRVWQPPKAKFLQAKTTRQPLSSRIAPYVSF